jgi:hypothetical protein
VRVLAVATVLGLALIAATGAPGGAASPARVATRLCAAGAGTTLGTVANPAIDELSGLVQSTAHAGVLWAANDSGDSARVFAVGTDGADLGIVQVAGATAADWEDLALGPGPGGKDHLFVGDIGGAGSTGNARSTVTVYRFAEPDPPGAGRTTIVTADTVTLQYPDGAHDAEALLLDARAGDLVIVTKVPKVSVAGVYRAADAATAPAGATIALERIGALGAATGTGLAEQLAALAGLGDVANSVTAGSASARAGVALIRTYTGVTAYAWRKGTSLATALVASPCRAPAPTDPRFPQGEAVAVAANGKDYITASEGVGTPLVQFRARK